jgi:hypothetical protein
VINPPSLDSVAACVATVDALYADSDNAETEATAAERRRVNLLGRVSALQDHLSLCEPTTLPEALIVASLLLSETLGNALDRDDGKRERIERIMRNLVRGLDRMVKADPMEADFVLPEWLTLPHRQIELEASGNGA